MGDQRIKSLDEDSHTRKRKLKDAVLAKTHEKLTTKEEVTLPMTNNSRRTKRMNSGKKTDDIECEEGKEQRKGKRGTRGLAGQSRGEEPKSCERCPRNLISTKTELGKRQKGDKVRKRPDEKRDRFLNA